jgi:DoxX-like family
MSGLTNRGPRAIGGLVLIVLPGLALTGSSIAKFAGIPAVSDSMAALGFSGAKLTFVAVLEIVGAALFLWKRTRSIGILWISAYLGGAICAHVRANEFQKAVSPAMVLALAGIGTWLRHPAMLWSMLERAGAENAAFDSRSVQRS